MDTTLGAVLALQDLGLRQVAGRQDHSRAVRWVAVSELLDPTPYLEGGEILLTTGMNLRAGDQDQLNGYVERIARRGVVALGLGVGLTHESAPQGLLEATDRVGLPLFEVPRPTPFIAISRAVADLVARSESEVAQRSLEHQRRLMRAAARPDAAPALLREIARLLDGWALVTDSRGVPMHSSAPMGADRASEVAGQVQRLRAHGPRATASIASADETVEIYPLDSARRPRWYLTVGLAVSARVDRGVLAAGVTLLSLAMESSGSGAAVDRRLRREVTRLLLEGEFLTAQSVQAVVGGSPIPDEVVVLVGAGVADLEQVVLDLQDDDPGCHADVRDDHVVVLCSPQRTDAVIGSLVSAGLLVGVSRPVSGSAAATGVVEARRALAAAHSDSGGVARFGALVSSGIADLVDPDLVGEWARATLAPLHSYSEGAGKVDLVASLSVYLAHHGQWHAAARELGIHRHTLRYRMRRAEELLGVSLDSPDTRMNLWLALRSAGPSP